MPPTVAAAAARAMRERRQARVPPVTSGEACANDTRCSKVEPAGAERAATTGREAESTRRERTAGGNAKPCRRMRSLAPCPERTGACGERRSEESGVESACGERRSEETRSRIRQEARVEPEAARVDGGQTPRTEVSPPAAPGGLNTPAIPADKPEAARNRPLPALLKDPLPRVTAILVSSDRRFATVDGGQIIGIGDVLGRRIVVAMDERSVVLREPSGMQIRIGLGGRVLGLERDR